MFLPEEVENTTKALLRGEIILYPTDTIWGLGCDATNENAINHIYKIKKRDKTKSLLILVSDMEMLEYYVAQVHPKINLLLSHHERPVTIIYPDAKNLPENLVAADGSIAIRIVRDNFCRKVIQALGRPLVSTSANFSGKPSPKNFGEIEEKLKEKVDYVVRHRQEELAETEPSVIVKLSPKGELDFIRN